MIGGEREIQFESGPEDHRQNIIREMIQYFGGDGLTEDQREIRTEALFDSIDDRRYEVERISLAESLSVELAKGEEMDLERKVKTESKLRVVESKTADLEREMDKKGRKPGYKEALSEFDGYYENLLFACLSEVHTKHPGMEEGGIDEVYDQLIKASLAEVEDTIMGVR
jgi:hypothetical protein